MKSVLYQLDVFILILALTAVNYRTTALSHARQRARKPVLGETQAPREKKPNIVLILTDDQDVELGSLNFMPKTLRLIRDKGAEFRHAYVTTPMCCPSRSSLLTGMYVHNHNVYTNNDNCSSTHWQTHHETRSFATYISNAGYRTGYFGKYLNKYNGSYIPPGWREWGGLMMNSRYYNYSINMNGKRIKHGYNYNKDYYTNLIVNDSIAFLKQSKRNNAHKPVLLTMSFPAPHGPEDSAPQYAHLFFNVTTHHTPSYDYAPNPDKQWILQVTKRMEPIHKQFTDLLMTKRLQTLQSVDAAVEKLIDVLEQLGELNNTYIIYTSDHGYHLGQFGLVKGKSFPFEFDVRVPFLIRGPGVEAGRVIDEIVLNIDLAPTFLEMADIDPPHHMDGRSLMPLLMNSKRKKWSWPDTFLIESSGRREGLLDGERIIQKIASTTAAKLFFNHESEENAPNEQDNGYDQESEGDDNNEEDEEEDYDNINVYESPSGRNRDENVLENDDSIIHGNTSSAAEENESQQVDNQLLPQVPQVFLNKFERLAVECLKDEYQLPCQQTQRWYCYQEDGRWRKHKCKPHNTIPLRSRLLNNCTCISEGNENIQAVFGRDIFEENRRIKHKPNFMLINSDTENIMNELIDDISTNLSSAARRTITLDRNKPKCIKTKAGNMNCTLGIYQNRKSWRKSRHYIENEIQKLKLKLENLKEIRKYLKFVKPHDLHANMTLEKENKHALKSKQILNSTPRRADAVGPPNKKKKPADMDDEEPVEYPNRYATLNGSVDVNEGSNVSYSSGTFDNSNNKSHRKHRHRHSDHVAYVNNVNILNHSSTSKTLEINRTLQVSSRADSVDSKPVDSSASQCYCPPNAFKHYNKDARDAKRKLKDQRARKKEKKERRKSKFEKQCLLSKMNCFTHDNEHWRTAPLWSAGPFCFCMNANNNTYSCIRTINSTHNFLYCEFTTGLVTFYNLRIDPFELQNRASQLKLEERLYMHNQLEQLKSCKGKTCTVKRNDGQLHNFANHNDNHHYKRRKFRRDHW